MAKKPLADELVQSSVRLPRLLFDQLQQSNDERGGRGVSEEIRDRLEASFKPKPTEETSDPKTWELLDAVNYVATNIRSWYGPWWENRFAFDVLKEAINRILTQRFQPKGEPVAKPGPLAEIVFSEGDHLKDKDTMGRMVAAIWLSSNPKREG